jgi:transcriptional regulator with XRE-family HTH domain
MPRKEIRRMDGHEAEEKKHFAIILGQVLQKLRTDLELSLLAVAEQAKISEATMCRYEHGARVNIPLHKMTIADVNAVSGKVRVPDLFSAYKIAGALGITLDELMAKCTALVVAAKKKGGGKKKDA